MESWTGVCFLAHEMGKRDVTIEVSPFKRFCIYIHIDS